MNESVKTAGKLILASASPRRRELLALAGYDFDIIVSDADERVNVSDPAVFVELAATKKAEAVAMNNPGRCVLGADTVVELSGRIIGKPRDAGDAFDTLSMLSGRTHTVYTGVCILYGEARIAFYDATRVTFTAMSPDDIRRYIATGEPLDKAGAYGIQGPGAVFVERIEGCYFTVIGLPLPRVYAALRSVGIRPRGL